MKQEHWHATYKLKVKKRYVSFNEVGSCSNGNCLFRDSVLGWNCKTVGIDIPIFFRYY